MKIKYNQNFWEENELAEIISSSSSSYIPIFNNNKTDEDFLNEINDEFKLYIGKDVCFQCIRMHVKLLKDFQKEINALKFITSKTETALSRVGRTV